MSGEKTEQPTDHRLRKAREDGQVAKSKDFTQTLLLGALFGYTLVDSENIMKRMVEIMMAPSAVYGMSFRGAVSILVSQALEITLWLVMPYVVIVIVVGIFAETIQTGLLLAFKMLIPKGDKLNPVTNLKQMFSTRNLVEFMKSNLKVIFLSALVWVVIRDSLDALIKIPPAGVAGVGLAVVEMMIQMVATTFIAYGVIAVFDFAYQRYSHIKGLMMSMDEIKQEYKQMEGDPHVKGHRKQLAQEIAMGEMVEKTRKASVVVTNPTHYAVALYYDEEETPLPIVLSKGQDLVAQQIVRVAKEEGIPVMQNVPLARALMSTAEIDQYIPSELIEPVAEVLRALRRMADERAEGEY
jgi:type III secretion protein U